jgi:hypothetical protein
MTHYPSSSSASSSSYAAVPEAILDLYNWPSEKGETWRHITDFVLVNGKGESTTLEKYEGTKECTLRGYLLPPPSRDNTHSPLLKRLVAIKISHFSIDFGEDDTDESRGFWLADFEDAWYKLEEPAPEYASIANRTKEKCQKFLEFYDVVVHLELDGGGVPVCARPRLRPLLQRLHAARAAAEVSGEVRPGVPEGTRVLLLAAAGESVPRGLPAHEGCEGE